jgi:CheY-like chemotaxis protein
MRNHSTPQPKNEWDELDIEQYSEQDLLLHDLREAIVEVSVCTNRVKSAYTALHMKQQEYMAGVAFVRSDAQMLCLTPLSTLIPDLRQTIMESSLAQRHQVNFEVGGENIEIDQKLLAALHSPLQQILQTCMPDTDEPNEMQKRTYHIWLNATSTGNIITIEIGFSMPIQGGAVEAISETLQQINGTITMLRNAKGAVSFLLHLPRIQDTVPCLTVRIAHQLFAIPVTQILRIGLLNEESFDAYYSLNELLDLSQTLQQGTANRASAQPALLVNCAFKNEVYAIVVDEIMEETALVIKPLRPYLKRPGIAEFALDGQSNVLLILNMPDLLADNANLQNRQTRQKTRQLEQPLEAEAPASLSPVSRPTPRILIAEDSAYQRQAIVQILQHTNYQVELAEARDGMDALEQLQARPPDILLLDIEMPNLSGFDVLNLIRANAEIPEIKTIMLTSRTSDKHRDRAMKLGAQAYLTKPCPEETLLGTIQKLLA